MITKLKDLFTEKHYRVQRICISP